MTKITVVQEPPVCLNLGKSMDRAVALIVDAARRFHELGPSTESNSPGLRMLTQVSASRCSQVLRGGTREEMDHVHPW
jgi:hypothetical protein